MVRAKRRIVAIALACSLAAVVLAPAATSFQMGKPKLNTRKGTATLLVTVPEKGKVTVTTEKRLAYTEIFFDGAGQAKLPIRARQGKPVQQLKANGELKVSPVISFVPQGPGSGSPSSKRITLILKLKG